MDSFTHNSISCIRSSIPFKYKESSHLQILAKEVFNQVDSIQNSSASWIYGHQDQTYMYQNVCLSHLALVEVIDYLLVKLVLKLSLRGGLVAISLGQVGCTWLV